MKQWLKVVAFFVLFPLIVGGMFIPTYLNHLKRAEEVMLQQNLWTMRHAIDFYRMDKKRRPKSLQDLVDSGYLREIPADPLTRSNKTWTIEREKASSVPNTPPGIIDVRSAASGADKNGKPYNRY